MNSSMEVLDHVRLNFSPSGLLFLNIALAFIMFGVALGIKIDDFKDIIQKPKSAITGIIAQFILLPLLTFLLVLLVKPSPTIALGMILVASCPGGNISNFISSMAKANAALSVSLTAFATLSAIFMTPLNFSIWGNLYVKFHNNRVAESLMRPLEIDQLQMFQTVFILLGLPVIAGILFASRYPKTTAKIIKPLKTASLLFFIIMVIAMLSANFDHFKRFVHLVFFIVLMHNALALATGFLFSTLMKRPRVDRRTITIETGIQNSGLALALMFNPKIFPPELELGGMAVIAAWWGIWHILSGLTMASLWSRKPLFA
ncbi:bile acid:sodium symporter family protein [Sunxiuqinia elliptica]|uniref:Bile acid:Na+ symporter, BASS family n=1 Tax=Sunxiuqinia elliptica TaxID=655355 RepID=A0A1I2EQ19_9BACT|nr:bile acid:sodium symporter family protein [Sunxiuqinia elliptica]SFE94915.1 bile acid:Na+ symporter, BASS family [Sunxiuqinia elliptica]